MRRPVSDRGTLPAAPRSFGSTVDGAPLQVWRPAEGNVELLVFAGIHGEEADSTVLLSRALRTLETPLTRVAVVLCANPDGMQRGTRGNTRGVDLNRNFPARNWQPAPVAHRWSVETGRNVTLSPGSAPGSEPEVRALLALVETLEPACVVSIHSPLGLIDDPDDTALGAALAAASGLPRDVIPNHETPGSFGSWAKDQQLPVITYELPDATLWQMLPLHLPVLERLLREGLAFPNG